MGNGVSTDQGSHTTHGLRDVRSTDEQKQHDWSNPEEDIELAGAPNKEEINSLLTSSRNRHNMMNKAISSSIKCTLDEKCSMMIDVLARLL